LSHTHTHTDTDKRCAERAQIHREVVVFNPQQVDFEFIAWYRIDTVTADSPEEPDAEQPAA
jgi:hypothetical protein